MPRPIPVQVKHCVVIAFEKALHLQAIYARVEDDLRLSLIHI